MQRVLRVRATGKKTKSPELVVIKFTVTGEDYDYEEAIKALNLKTEILRNDIIKAGFSGDDLKTTNFFVETVYQRVNNQKIFQGYKARGDHILSFNYDKEVLNNLLTELASSKSKAEFNIFFEVKDKEAFKNEILAEAVNNGKNSAKVIANAANIKLGKILNIIYDVQEIIYRSKLALALQASAPVNIIPEDIEGTENITMEWEIED